VSGLPPSVPIAILASAPWETPAPVNVHQIARRLAARGHKILFVESTGLRAPSLRSAHDRSRVMARLRAARRGPRGVAEGLFALAPLAVPADWPAPARALSDFWVAGQVRCALRRLAMPAPLVWSFLPTWLGVARRLGGRRLVYHCVDRYAANPGVDAARIDAAEAAMLRAADRVLATSPVLADHLRPLRSDVVCVPNVADVALFSRAVREPLQEPPALAGLARPRAVYTGNVAGYRVDLPLLAGVADARPDLQLVLVGAVGLGDPGGAPQGFAELIARPNVHAFGPRPQDELPAWLRHADVALIPFLDNAHTRGSLPLKLWEYLAAGLPVVATPLPNLVPLAEDGTLRVAGGVEAFVAALGAALGEPEERRSERLSRAQAHDWEPRVEELLRLVAEPGGPDRVR
jgi:glycosyltransferase involved in cell wall biosynthesis